MRLEEALNNGYGEIRHIAFLGRFDRIDGSRQLRRISEDAARGAGKRATTFGDTDKLSEALNGHSGQIAKTKGGRRTKEDFMFGKRKVATGLGGSTEGREGRVSWHLCHRTCGLSATVMSNGQRAACVDEMREIAGI